MAIRMQQRTGTYLQWNTSNPVLNGAEIGYESDTNKFKIGDGSTNWNDLPYFLDEVTLETSLDGYIPSSLLGANNGVAQLNSSGKLVSTQIPNVDEITQDAINTALVAGTGLDKTYDDNANTITIDIDSTVATKTYADGVAGAAQVAAELTASGALSTHASDSTSVHGITDTAELATKAFAASLLTGATKTNISITGDKDGLTISAENGVADSTTTDLAEGTNLYFTDERAQDAVGNNVGSGLAYTDSTGAIGINYVTLGDTLLDGVSGASYGLIGTSAYLDVKNTNGYNKEIELDIAAVKTQLNTDGYITDSSTSTLTNKTLTSPVINGATVGGDLVPSTDATYDLGSSTNKFKDLYLSGTTLYLDTATIGLHSGNIQLSHSGNVTTVPIGGGNHTVATESYVDGEISLIQSEVDDKAPLASPTFTGTVTSTNNLVVDGDFTVNGTNFSASATSITIEDNMVQLAHQNAANTVDLGLVVGYNDGVTKHSGIVRDVSDDKWKLFKGVTTEPTTTVNFGQGSLDNLQVAGFEASSATIGDVSNTELQYLNGVTSAVQTQIDAKAPIESPTFTGTVTIPNGAVLGTPTSATLTNATGLPVSTGISGLGTGVATFLGTPTAANLATMVTDETGSGNLVFATSPTLVTPVLGVATGTSFNSITGLSSTTPSANSTAAVGTATTTARADHVHPTTGLGLTSGTLAQFAATTSSQLAGVISDETGSGSLVFATSPTLVTPTLGVATATSINGTSIPSSKTLVATDSTVVDGTTSSAASGVGFMGLPQNSTTTGAYAVVAADAGKHIYSTATRTVTIPANSAVALPIGTTLTFISAAGATTTIAITTDTMLLAGAGTTGSRTLAAHGMATAVKITSTSWIISGNGLS